MAKRKNNKQNTDSKNVNISFPDGIDKEEMIDIISSAIVKANEKEKENEQIKKQKEIDEWQKKIGLKDFSNKKRLSKYFLTLLNKLGCFFRIIFMPKAKIDGNHATKGLMKIAVKITFKLACFIFWLFAIGIIASYPYQFITPLNNYEITIVSYLYSLPFAFLLIVVAQLFRIAGIEVNKMEDKNYLADILAITIAILACIVSIFAR